MIKIYDINDKLLMQAEVTSAAKREQEMSKSDYISLSFSAAEKVILPVGAYINYTYKIDKVREVTRKFLLLESYEPTQSDECSWKYTPQFQHPKMILSKTPFFIYTRNSQNVEVKQNVWSFVGITSALAEKIKDFLNKDIKFGNSGWKVIFSNVTANTINVSFSDNDFISALTAITNAIGDNCEWHIDYDDEIIYIGKVLIGATPVVLEVGKNVGVPSINNSKEGYYNAFSIFGGTRNITQVNSKGENVSSGDIRLQLDEGNGTILIDGKERSYSIDKYSTLELRADKIKEPLFTKVLDLSQIFPSLNTYVYNVRGRVKYVLDEKNNKIPISNADGSVKGYKTFTVWYMRLAYPTTEEITGKTIINTTVDDGVTHYWYDFEITDNLLINGKNIGCSFEPNFNTGALSTPLAGRGTNGDYVGFELTYHKEASSSHSSDDVSDSNFSVLAGDYEIIYQEDNEVIIPTNAAEMLIPRGESMPSLKCNITVLYNIAMADTIYYEDAQNRLLEKAKEEIVRLLSDMNNYEVKSYPDVFLEDNPQLQIGQNVTYKDGHGYELATRVLKLSTNIDFGFIQTITLGNQVIKGTITQLKEDVQTIIASGGSSGNGGGYSVSQLRNLIAKYGSDNFLSKQFDDIAKGLITFMKGLVSDGLAKLNKGAYFGKGGALIDEAGRAILESLQSIDYDNEAEQGFAVKKENGKYNGFITNLTIWGKAIFNQLDVRKLSYAGGNVYLSGSGSKIVKVVPVIWESESSEWHETTVDECEGWLCYLLADDGTTATENLWKEGDQVRCKTIGTLATGTMNASNKSYWRTIPANGVSSVNEKIYDGYGNELYGGQMFSWIVLGKHSMVFDGGDESSASPEIAGIPEAGDTIVLDGSRNDMTRQGVLILESTGENTPRIVGFKGVNRYTHENKEVFVLSPDRIRLNSSIFEWVSSTGDAMHMVNYRGEWKAGSYDYYDQVNHNNALWTCINENGTSQEPSDASSDWQKVLSGEKGEKGEKGDRGDEGPQGPKGEQGTHGVNGNDGTTWLLTPDTLMYDTDDNGKAINVGTGKTTTLRVLRGDEELTDVTIVGVKNMVNCVASRLNETNSFYISVIAVQKAALGTDTIDVSCTNGSFDIDFTVDGVTYTATAKFAVNVSAFTGKMTLSNKQFKTEINSMQSGLETLDSKITQTAEDITLSVSKKKAGRRNLLYGTDFTRDGLIDINPHFQPTITEGMNGMNAVRFSVTASDSFQYYGLFWRGEYGNITVTRNTDYTFSCWVKSDNPHAMLYTERYSKSDATTSERGTAIPLSKGDVWWRNDGNWQLVTNTFNSGNTDFVEITIFLFNADENSEPTLNAQAWFCMPMLEEGLEYTGWTLSERDSDYVGGNMLDDTRTLVASSQQSNLLLAQDVTADAYEGAYAVAHGKADDSNNNSCDFLRWNGEGGRVLDFGQGKNYVFSFLAKGNGTLIAYMYKDSVHASIYSENSQGYVVQSIANGASNFTLTSQWKRYWVHWRIDPYTGEGDTVLPQSVLLRAVDGCEVWVTKPKLEEGAQMTEYTEKKTDLIDKTTAKAAGLEITSDKVILQGEKVEVKNGNTTAAMFQGGKLNADLIDAETINVHHVWAKDGNNKNTLAHFGNYGIDEAKDEKGRSCPLWVGSSTASSSPFRVSKDGYMYAEKGAFGKRYYEDEESGEQRAYGRFEITENGIETGELFKEDSMSLTDTSFYLIKKIGDNKTSEAVFLDSHGETLPTPGLGVYLNAKVRVDATGILSGKRRSNVCYYANAKNGLQNYAMYGSGDISLDGGVYAYKATMINLKTKNVFLDNTGSIKATTYNEPQMIDSLTLLVNSQNELALTLPTLGTIEQMLFGSYAMKGKFCVRLTIVMDIGSALVHIRGRSVIKDQAGVAQWNYADFPLMFKWDGGYAPGLKMAAGESCEILLTYDPDKKYKTDIFEQPYIARIINFLH